MSESRVIITAQADQAIREFDRLRAQATGSLEQMGEMGEKLDSIQDKVGDVVKGILAVATVNAFVGIIDGSIEALDNLKDLSAITKISIEDLSGLKLAAEQSGADLAGTADAIAKMTVSMGKNQGKFAALGITAKEPLEAFKQFADVFSAVEDPQERAALAADVLGRSWQSAAPLLSEGSKRIGEMVAEGRALSGATSAAGDQADQFGDDMARLKAAIEGAKMSLTKEMLPTIIGVTEAIKSTVLESGRLEALWSVIGSIGAAVVPAMKIAAAYFAIFVAAPAAIALVVSAFTPLLHALALYTFNLVIGQAQTISFNRALWGTSVSAQLAAGSLTKMKLAGSLMFAAFAGWEIGTYLRENFVEARVAGLWFVGGILKGWEHLKHGAELAWEGIRFAWDKTINTMKLGFAAYLSTVAQGFAAIGAKKTSDEIVAYAASLQAAVGSQKSFEQQTAGLVAAHKQAIGAIDENIMGLVAYELSTDSAAAAEKEANKGKEASAGITDEQRKATEELRKSQNQFISGLEKEVAELGLSETQIKLNEAVTLRLTGSKLAHARAMILHLESYRAEVAWAKESAKANLENLEGLSAQTVELRAAALAQRDQNDRIGLGKVAIAELDAQRLEYLAGLKDEKAELAENIDWTGRMSNAYRDQATALRDRATGIRAGAAMESGADVTQAKELLDILGQVDEATKAAAQGMTDSFGSVGAAIGGLTTSLSGYGRAQAAISAQLAADSSAARGDEAKLLKLRLDAAQKSAQAQVKSYGDMAGAAKGFFKDGTKGYGALQAAEKAFRAFEMAMAVKNMLVKSGLLQAFTGLFVSAKATETAATVASIGPDVAASQIKGQAAAVAGVATQAKGDPYTAWGRMAAMAATMAALGYIVSGGKGGSGGGQTAAEAQAQQGTGTVFGDSTAKSNSIGRSIELMQKNSAIELAYTGGMLSSLRAIEKSMSGLTNILLQTDGVANGTNMGIQEGTISRTSLSNSIAVAAFDKIMTGGLLGKLTSLWGSTKQNLVDSGIQIRGTVNQLQAGSGFNQYASIDTTKKSAFGLKKKTTNRVETQGLDANISAQFGLIFRDLETALGDAAVAVGGNAAQVAASLDSLKIDTKVSLKDLKGDDLTAALNAVLSKTMDQMAKAALPAFDQFREVGEGYAETVMRVTANYVNLDSIMQSIGTTFGATGMVSLAARERLIELAGGIDSLAAQTNSFAESFLTGAERIAPVRKYVTEQLAAMGLAGITTRDQFKSVVLGIDKTTAAGAAQYTQLLALSDAFAKAYAAAEDLTKSTQAIADERKDLLEELDALTMTEAQLLNKKRMALDASNRGLFDYVESMRAARVAQDAAKAGFTDVIGRMKTFGDSIRTFRDGLTMGNLSTLTVEQQYAEARRQYGATRAAALAGDANAQGALSAAINSFLTISQKVNGSDSLYAADFAGAMKDSEELASWASDQVDVAKASLDALQQQVIGMNSLNLTMQTVADTVTNFTGAMLGVSATTGQLITAGTTGAANTEALVAQVRALTAEVAALRADQQRQTGAIIEAQVGAAQRAADTISTNARDVAVDTAWQARNSKVQLA